MDFPLNEGGEREVSAEAAATVVVRPAKRTSQGRQRIDITYIKNKNRRQVTFCKRRNGLFKKAGELSQLCGAHVAVIVFSEASRAFAIGAPSVDDVLRAYAPITGEDGAWLPPNKDEAAACRAAVETALRQEEETKARLVAEKARMKDVGKKVLQAMAGRRFWWEADVDQLGDADLPEFARALQRLRDNVQRHIKELISAAPLLL